MVTILGWLRAEAERASCSKRCNRSLPAENAAGRILIATLRSRRVSRPRYTLATPACAQQFDNLILSEFRARGEGSRRGQLQNFRRGCIQKLASGLLVRSDQRLHFAAQIGIRTTR